MHQYDICVSSVRIRKMMNIYSKRDPLLGTIIIQMTTVLQIKSDGVSSAF